MAAGAAQPFDAQPESQHEGLQQLFLQANKRSNRPGLHTGLQQELFEQLLQLWHAALLSQPHEGAAAAQVGAAAAQVGAGAAQVGAGAAHEGAAAAQPLLAQPLLQPVEQHFLRQQRFAPQGSHEGLAQQRGAVSHPQLAFAGAAHDGPAVQQLLGAESQPQPLPPSMRFKRSKPKLWVQRPRPSTNVPTKMFHFIEPHLLLMELGSGQPPPPTRGSALQFDKSVARHSPGDLSRKTTIRSVFREGRFGKGQCGKGGSLPAVHGVSALVRSSQSLTRYESAPVVQRAGSGCPEGHMFASSDNYGIGLPVWTP